MITRVTTFLAALVVAHAAPAQPETAQRPARRQLEWVVQTLADPPAEAAGTLQSRLADDFKKAVPETMLANQLAQLRAAYVGGGPLRIERWDAGETDSHAAALIRSAETGAALRIALTTDESGELIAGMNFKPVAVGGKLGIDSWNALDEHLAGLHGTVSLAAMRVGDDGQVGTVHAYNADESLAIGSTFKLYVLGALAERIAEADASWEDTLAIRKELKSLPSGTMQALPPGTERTLAQFAAKMISISDNTATDHVLHYVGRERVEDYVAEMQADPSDNLPFLTTLEMFKIKLSGDPQLPARYADAGVAERRRMIAEGGEVAGARPKMALASMWKVPQHIDRVEWFATTPELCRVMADLHRMESQPGMEPLSRALRLNPGVGFMSADWARVAFKGGSEPGVLNFTWLLERDDGRRFALSITWNDTEKPVDQMHLIDVAGEAIALLHAHER